MVDSTKLIEDVIKNCFTDNELLTSQDYIVIRGIGHELKLIEIGTSLSRALYHKKNSDKPEEVFVTKLLDNDGFNNLVLKFEFNLLINFSLFIYINIIY